MFYKSILSKMWSNIQYNLFPFLEETIGPLSSEQKQLISILELVRIEEFLPCSRFNFGRPKKDRSLIARAFIAKIVLKIQYTKQLVKQLKTDKQLKVICGWDKFCKIPSEAKFSRVFKEFAQTSLPDIVHQALIEEIYKDNPIFHLTKDSTAICVREKPLKKPGTPKERKLLKSRQNAMDKKNGTSRKQKQLKQDLDTMIQELPIQCDIGAKKGTSGYKVFWKGYKLHVAIDDNCIPISAIISSASLSDSEVAIPLAEKANKISKNYYDLMDSAYDAEEILKHSLSLGHSPIIDKNSRSPKDKKEKLAEKKRKKIINFCTAEEQRYKLRFPKERFNAVFKDYYGGRNIYYKGAEKVFTHLMFGVLSLTASLLLSSFL